MIRPNTIGQVALAAVALLTPDLLLAELRVQSPERVDTAVVRAVREEGFGRSHIRDDLRYLSDVIGPRLTGSPAMDRASMWAADKMREYGLANVHREAFHFGRGWEEVRYSGRMTTPFTKPLHGRSVAWAGSTNGPQEGNAAFIGARSLDELQDGDGAVRDSWVLIDSAEANRRLIDVVPPRQWSDEEILEREVETPRTRDEMKSEAERFRRWFEVRRWLADQGAVGIIRRSLYRSGTLGWVESIMGEEIPPEVLQPGPFHALPTVILADRDYALIYRNLVVGVPVTLEFDIQNNFVDDDPQSHNTIGEIVGTDLRDEFVVIGAHLDSWPGGTGATDDGVGSILVLDAMRILSAIGARPRRTIRAGLWSGEEPEGLDHTARHGSRAYVKAHLGELERTSVYLNLDEGSGRIRGIWEQNNPGAAGIIEEILRPLRDLGVVGMKPGFFVGSDDISFDEAGVPAFPFVHDRVDPSVYHTDADTFESASIDDMKQAAVVIAVVAYHLAMRDDLLPRRPR